MKKRPRVKEIESEKTVIVIFPDKDNPKAKQWGMVENLSVTEEGLVAKVKPLVYQCAFEGKPIGIKIRGKGLGKFYEKVLKQFESSQDKVIVLQERRAFAYRSQERFNEVLEALLRKMTSKEYLEELHKSAKKGYVI